MWSAAESFFARLGEFGTHIALAEGERTLTYAELLGAVAARGRHLRALGAHRVALALDNGIDWVLWAWLCCTQAWSAYRCRRSSLPISSVTCSTVPASTA